MDAPPAGNRGSTEMVVECVVLVTLVLVPVPVVLALVPVPVVLVLVPVDVTGAAVPVLIVAVSEAVLVPLAVCVWVFEAVEAVSVMASAIQLLAICIKHSAGSPAGLPRFKISSNIFGDDHATDARSTRLKITLNIVKERMFALSYI